LKALNIRRSCGYDAVSPYVLNKGANGMTKTLNLILQMSFTAGDLPDMWKKANTAFQKGKLIIIVKLQTRVAYFISL
jgi:hypothetical protein